MLIDLISINCKHLFVRKKKLYTTIASIAIGVALVILVSAVGSIGSQLIAQEMDSFGIGSVTLSVNKGVSNVALTEEKLDEICSMPEVESAIPVLMSYTQVAMKGKTSQAAVWGVGEGSSQIISLNPVHGRIFTQADLENKNMVCLVDENMAIEFYGRSNIVGKKIDIVLSNQRMTFEIVGVVQSGGNLMQNMLSGYVPYFVYTPYNVLRETSGKESFDSIAITLENQEQADELGQRIASELALQYQEDVRAYQVENIFKQKENLEQITQIIQLVLLAISGVSLFVSGLGVMTVMTASAVERTKEIGIKKAIGAKNQAILWEFILEGGCISLLGCLLGISIGVFFTAILTILLQTEFPLQPQLFFTSIAVTVSMGMLFSTRPALKAASINPVCALNSD